MTSQTPALHNLKKPFWDHIADLRRLLYVLVAILLVSATTIHYFIDSIVPFLLAPLGDSAPPLQFLGPLEPLFFILKIDFVGGLIVTLPALLIGVYQFINPTPWRQFALPMLVILTSSSLALLGAAYSYFIIVPIVLGFMNSLVMPGTIAAFTATGFMNFLLGTSFMLVLIFQIPIVTVLGSMLGVINPHEFSQYRRNAYLAIFVATAIITPTTDIITLFLVSLPAILVTEIGVAVGKFFYKK